MLIFDLPLKNGVSPSKVQLPILKNSPKKTLLSYLSQTFAHIDNNDWQQRFLDRQIFVAWENGFLIVNADDDYQKYQGKTLYYYRSLADEIHVPFYHETLFENERLMVVDKPHFLTMTPSGNYVCETLLTRLKEQTNNGELTPIHRLDKDTAGLVLFCKDKKYRHAYQSLFAHQAIKKVYHAIALFNENIAFPLWVRLNIQRANPFYTMQVVHNHHINSKTWINLLQIDKQKTWAKYELRPITGKLHQLRVHLNHLGLPIKNDPYYPTINHRPDNDFNNPLQLLAKSLEFIDPIDGECYRFVSKRQLVLS